MEMVLFNLLAGFLAILGIASAVEWAMSSLGCGGRCYARLTLLPVSGRDEDIEQRLRCAYNSLRYDRWMPAGELLVVDMGADPETWAVCRAFAAHRADLRLCTAEEAADLLGEDAIYKTLVRILY